jgi:hypothetical protein
MARRAVLSAKDAEDTRIAAARLLRYAHALLTLPRHTTFTILSSLILLPQIKRRARKARGYGAPLHGLFAMPSSFLIDASV